MKTIVFLLSTLFITCSTPAYYLPQSELARKNYISLANSKYASGIIRNSIIDLAQNTTANLKNAVTYFDQGNTKYKLGDKKGAITDFDQAISINPKYAPAYYLLGMAKHVLGGDEPAAKFEARKAIELCKQLKNT
jgi:tetratricopeptide (TPR) repeat protein